MLDEQVKLLILMTILIVSAKKSTGTEPISSDGEIDYEEHCKTHLCIPKCCPKNQYVFGYNKRCAYKKKMKKDFSEIPLYYSNLTKSGMVLRDATLVPGRMLNESFNETVYDYSVLNHRYYLTLDGLLIEEKPNHLHRFSTLDKIKYCVDYLLPMKVMHMKIAELRIYSYVSGTQVQNENSFYAWGLLASCFFLALVLVVYALLQELRNLSGHVLMAYVASLFCAFLLIAVMQIDTYDEPVCQGLTYCTYFFLLASFCWMNIMSCDIWWTFRGYAKARPIHRRGETFKFCMYCSYAFGIPAAMTSMMIVLDNVDMQHMPWIVTPKINLYSCFLGDDEKLLYLYVPMLIMILSNWIFFLMTAFNIWRLHRATAVLDSAAAGNPAAHRNQKFRFMVYLKLSIIMGINWVLEVVSSFSPDFKGWYISDVYNLLVGLSIFLIFVCKKKILRKLVKRFSACNEWQKSHPWVSRSRSSNATESDVSTDMPICVNPKGLM